MKVALTLNVLWSFLMTIAFSYLLIGAYSSLRAILVVLCICYIITAFNALFKKRWAVIISVLVAGLLMFRWLPMVVINIWMFSTGHPLYADSPGTILIVLINAILFAIPSTLLCVFYFVNRKKFGSWLADNN